MLAMNKERVAFGSALPYWFHRFNFEFGSGLVVDGVQYDDDTFDLYILLDTKEETTKSHWRWVTDVTTDLMLEAYAEEQPFLLPLQEE